MSEATTSETQTETQVPTSEIPNPVGLDSVIPSETIESESQPAEVAEPDKFLGKTREDIINNYNELEKKLGQQGNELGELRKVADNYLNPPQPETQNVRQEQPKSENLDFYGNPEEAVTAKINEALEPFKQDQYLRKKEQFGQALSQAHPDYNEYLNDAKFREWVEADPVNIELFVRADKQLDLSAANRLFGDWERTRPSVNQRESMPPVDEETEKAAMLETKNTADVVSSAKIYRRADLINLRNSNPEKYRQLEPEIRKAYAEKRVR